MKYLTGIHALNLNCCLDTCGDWHKSALNWNDLDLRESEGSFFGDYGIETNHTIPEHTGKYCVANHIRALLDLILDRNFAVAQGMNKDFICNDKYNSEIFEKVCSLRNLSYWNEISDFMGKEYMMEWVNFLSEKGSDKKFDFQNTDTDDRQIQHKKIIEQFLHLLNRDNENFILKGSTALMLCYCSEKFSENINLDSLYSRDIQPTVEKFCREKHYFYQISENTDTVKHFIINYGNAEQSIYITVSYKQKHIPKVNYSKITGITVYTLPNLCLQTLNTYHSQNTLNALSDLAFICNQYYEHLPDYILDTVRLAIETGGMEYFKYLLYTRNDRYIDKNRLLKDLHMMYEKLGLRFDVFDE